MIKKLLFLLVLLLTAATGAWAQSAFTAKEITSASQLTSTDDEAYVAACMPSDFLAVDAVVATAWTGAPTDGSAMLIYAIDGNKIKIATFLGGSNKATTGATWSIATFKTQMANSKFYYTAAAGYTVSLKDGTQDAGKWTVKAGTDGSFQSLPLKGVKAGTKVKLKYDGDRSMLKGVTATSEAAAKVPAKAYLKWDADQKKLVETEIPTGATTVTSSTTTWSAGTYVVEGEVNITGMIELKGDVDLIIKDGAKLTVNSYINGDFKNLSIYGQAKKTGQLVVNCSDNHAISGLSTLEVHSAEVTATASGNNKHGGISSDKFNVYGGLVDAKTTAADGGYGISLSGGGSMDIYGGEVKAEGKGNGDWDCGIVCGSFDKAPVTVHGGKLWAGNADKKAFNYITLTIDKSSFSGKIETSDDDKSWTEYTSPETPGSKYVRVGF